MKTRKLYIRPDGTLEALYDDGLLPLLRAVGGNYRVRRAALADPDPAHPGRWLADLRLSGGPVVTHDPATGCPFVTEESAKAYEDRWLHQHNLGHGRAASGALPLLVLFLLMLPGLGLLGWLLVLAFLR